MANLFMVLLLISILALVVGLIYPKLFSKLFKKKTNHKTVGLVFIPAIVLFFILFGITVPSNTIKTPTLTKTTEPAVITSTPATKTEPSSTATSTLAPTTTTTPAPTKKKYEELDNIDLILNCTGGDEIVLWDKPTGAGEGARMHDRVPCGTIGFAYSKFYNEGLKITFYGVNTNDTRVKNAWGWVTEDLITWR